MSTNIIRLFEDNNGVLTVLRNGDTHVVRGLEFDAEAGERFLSMAQNFDAWAGECYSEMTADAFLQGLGEGVDGVREIAEYDLFLGSVDETGQTIGANGKVYLGMDD